MGAASLTTGRNLFGAGQILMAPVTASIPTLAAAAGKFGPVSAWTGWTQVGGTSAGLTLTRNPATADFVPAESYYPTHILVTGDDIQGSFILNEISKANLAYAFNAANAATLGATAAANAGSNWSTGASGADAALTATSVSAFSLPLIGQEVRCMLGWQSQNDDEVVFIYQALNTASVAPNFTKGPQSQDLQFTLRGELPSTNPDTNCGFTSTQVTPYRWYLAGQGPNGGSSPTW